MPAAFPCSSSIFTMPILTCFSTSTGNKVSCNSLLLNFWWMLRAVQGRQGKKSSFVLYRLQNFQRYGKHVGVKVTETIHVHEITQESTRSSSGISSLKVDLRHGAMWSTTWFQIFAVWLSQNSYTWWFWFQCPVLICMCIIIFLIYTKQTSSQNIHFSLISWE